MSSYRVRLWNYPLFQIPLILLSLCLVAAMLFWLLGFGQPKVAVAIALDLSSSTYGEVASFNAPGTILEREVKAVEAYLQQNNEEILLNPNQVKVFGFGDTVKPLTGNFEANSNQVATSLSEALKTEGLATEIGSGTDLNLAIKTGINALRTVPKRCRELILVTDGIANVSPGVIVDASANRVKINSVVIGQEALALRGASFATGGIYLSGDSNNLSAFFTDNFFSTRNEKR